MQDMPYLNVFEAMIFKAFKTVAWIPKEDQINRFHDNVKKTAQLFLWLDKMLSRGFVKKFQNQQQTLKLHNSH